MALYRRFMVDAFRLQKYVSAITLSRKSSPSDSRIFRFCQTLLRSFVLNSQQYKSPFLDGSKRFFKPKGFKFWTGLLGYGVVSISTYYWNLERVPYTKRSHFVLLSTSLEKELGESFSINIIKSRYEGKILPPLHPTSVRIQRIGHEIIEAAQKGLRKEEECLIIENFKKLGKRDYRQIPPFEWEFFVVLSTRLLDVFDSDSEIAAFIGHEVSHGIARHFAERFTRFPVLIILNLFLYWRINLHLIPSMPKFLARLPYFQRKEKEADYIWLILVALAGYDPREVVDLLEIGVGISLSGWPLFDDYLYTHPTRKKRVQLLSQPKVMDEALSLYREVLAQRWCSVDPHISRNTILNIFRKVLVRDKV